MSAEEFQAISQLVTHVVSQNRWSTSFQSSAAILIIYDTFLNLDMEISLVWRSPWTAVKVLYLFQRYLPFIDGVGILMYLQGLTDPVACFVTTKVLLWIGFIGILCSEALMSARVWAVWGRHKYITAGVGTLYIGCFIPAAFYLGKFIQGVIYPDPSFPIPNRQGCFAAGTNNLLYLSWTMLAVYDTATFILMMVPVARAYHSGGKTGITRIMYRDGITYFVFQLFCSLTNIVIITTNPGFEYLLSCSVRALHSIIASRAILHIRQQSITQGIHVASGNQLAFRSIQMETSINVEIDSNYY
ncbi:hypothetical protein PM082_024890 [Marasmius tenuissimus]|nr:hypothetical protein PM082_024890 [Marasmius tenuissimus]